MGGMKQAINLMLTLVEEELSALPERIYLRLHIETEATTLNVSNQHGYRIVAEVMPETGCVYVRGNFDTAMFTGNNAPGAAGRYINYLLECDE